jgi:fused signal recognition particle receptor
MQAPLLNSKERRIFAREGPQFRMIQTLFGSLNEPEKKSLFDRMKEAVTRTRDNLGEKIESVIALTREVDEAALEELETVLISSDIGVTTSTEIITALRERAKRHQIRKGAELKQLLKEQLTAILDEQQRPAANVNPPLVIMLVGVNGTGKTTTTGKLAGYFRRDAKTVLLCAADTFRAAAIEQLEVWGQRSGVEMIKTRQGGDPSAVLFDALQAAKARSTDVVIADTAGRLHTKNSLMAELDKMRRTAQRIIPTAPHEVLLVMDATTGQNGLQQARLFTESAGVTGIVLTKLDGTAKGGIAVAIARELKLPVRYVGVGEKIEDLLPFDSEAFVESLLGG